MDIRSEGGDEPDGDGMGAAIGKGAVYPLAVTDFTGLSAVIHIRQADFGGRRVAITNTGAVDGGVGVRQLKAKSLSRHGGLIIGEPQGSGPALIPVVGQSDAVSYNFV